MSRAELFYPKIDDYRYNFLSLRHENKKRYEQVHY